MTRGSALSRIAFNAVGLVLFLLWAVCPAAAAGDELRVIAVHTGASQQVTMVVEPPSTARGRAANEETCTVTFDGETVATTVEPMASGDLSVALVIDTATSLTAEELAAVQKGAIDFLLGLPPSAQTMVVTAGGEPEVVASLDAHPAEAVGAISALSAGGSRDTSAATRLAAESLQSAPPGPRVIVVYTRGADDADPSVEQLSDAVLQADAVIDVIPTGSESIWPSVVERAGGVVLPPTGAADIAQSYGRLATMLSDQYLVTFQAPDELPALAQVAFRGGDQEYRTVVDVPDADTEQAAPTEGRPSGSRGIAALASLLVAGLVLIVLIVLALVRRTGRRASVGSGPPATEEISGGPSSNGAPSGTPATAPATSTLHPPPRRGSLSAAVQGRRSAQQALNSAPEQQIRPSSDDPQLRDAHDATQARRPNGTAPPQQAMTSADARKSPRPSGVAQEDPAPAAADQQHSAPERHDIMTVLTGSGDAETELTKTAPGPAIAHISGNSASQYFAVGTLATNNVLVTTTEPYDGVRPLDWDGEESTGFKIWATGPWRIEVLPLSAIPSFTGSFSGNGNMAVHFTGTGSLARIAGNNERQRFEVSAVSAYGPYHRLVDTTGPYAGECQISRGPQVFEVQAIGSWTITVT